MPAPDGWATRGRSHAAHVIFVERLGPSELAREDIDTARIVTRIQAGDRDAFGQIYMRYFDRVFGYLRIALEDPHEAEDATQQVFMQALEAISRFEHRGTPFRAWLFRIAKNKSIDHLSRRARVDLRDGHELDAQLDETASRHVHEIPKWLTDEDLLVLIERLPSTQRQVIMLRYLMDLSFVEIAGILGRSPEAVRQLHRRALQFLRGRLEVLGHAPRTPPIRVDMTRRAASGPVARARRSALAQTY